MKTQQVFAASYTVILEYMKWVFTGEKSSPEICYWINVNTPWGFTNQECAPSLPLPLLKKFNNYVAAKIKLFGGPSGHWKFNQDPHTVTCSPSEGLLHFSPRNEQKCKCKRKKLSLCEAPHLRSSGKQIKGTAFLPRVEINVTSPTRTGHGDLGDAHKRETKKVTPPLPTCKRALWCWRQALCIC